MQWLYILTTRYLVLLQVYILFIYYLESRYAVHLFSVFDNLLKEVSQESKFLQIRIFIHLVLSWPGYFKKEF